MRVHIAGCFSVRSASTLAIFAALFCCAPDACAQAGEKLVTLMLQQRLQTESVVADQLRHFMLARVPPLLLPPEGTQWGAEVARLRARELAVVYHGWPQAWVDAPPRFEEVGTLEGHGYRIRTLRYELDDL
jgi:hypothetical protein